MMKRREHSRLGHYLMPSWMDAQVFGRVRWMKEHPKRYHLLIKEALIKSKYPFHEQIVLWNEHHHPLYRGRPVSGAYQSIDYLLRVRGLGVVALLVYNPKSYGKTRERESFASKETILNIRNVPYYVLPTHYSSQEYWVKIVNWIRTIRPTILLNSPVVKETKS